MKFREVAKSLQIYYLDEIHLMDIYLGVGVVVVVVLVVVVLVLSPLCLGLAGWLEYWVGHASNATLLLVAHKIDIVIR